MEPKPEKVRPSSVSSSVDETSYSSAATGLKGASDNGGGECCCVQPDGDCCTSTHCSRDSSVAADKNCRGKLWSSSRKVGGKCSSKRLLEQRSTNSFESDSPSLSGSLPSVAGSHGSHLSLELGYSDPETSRAAPPPCSSSADTQLPTPVFADVAVTLLTEVGQDQLEQFSSKGLVPTHHVWSAPSTSPKEGSALYISEVGGGAEPENETTPNALKNMTTTPENSRRKTCIQTDM